MALSAVTCGSNILKSWAPPVALVVNNLPTNAGHVKDVGSVPRLGRPPGGGHDNPFQYSCLRIKWTEEPDIVKTQIFPLQFCLLGVKESLHGPTSQCPQGCICPGFSERTPFPAFCVFCVASFLGSEPSSSTTVCLPTLLPHSHFPLTGAGRDDAFLSVVGLKMC